MPVIYMIMRNPRGRQAGNLRLKNSRWIQAAGRGGDGAAGGGPTGGGGAAGNGSAGGDGLAAAGTGNVGGEFLNCADALSPASADRSGRKPIVPQCKHKSWT